jgi:hypothetical protein
MKTQDTAINYVYGLLTGETPGHDVQTVYKWRKPTQASHTEYIAINALPVTAGVMQQVRVNVNFHCRDKYAGVPDTQRLEEVTADLVATLEQVDGAGIHIDFESQEYIADEPTGYTFSNIRLHIKMIN